MALRKNELLEATILQPELLSAACRRSERLVPGESSSSLLRARCAHFLCKNATRSKDATRAPGLATRSKDGSRGLQKLLINRACCYDALRPKTWVFAFCVLPPCPSPCSPDTRPAFWQTKSCERKNR